MFFLAQSAILGMNPWLVYGAVFGLIAAMAWLALDFFGGKNSRVDQRLDDLSDPSGRKRTEVKGNSMSRMLEAAAPASLPQREAPGVRSHKTATRTSPPWRGRRRPRRAR